MTSVNQMTDAAALLKHLGMPMPPAMIELYQYLPGRDDSARLIMVMPDADWAKFSNLPPLASISAEDRYDHSQAGLLSSDDGAWRPNADPAIAAAQTWLGHGEFLVVGYSPAGAGRTRVYLLWGQT